MLELYRPYKLQDVINYLNTQSKPNQERILQLLEHYNEGGKDNVFKIPMKVVTGLFAVIEVTYDPFKIVKCRLMSSRMIINYSDEQIITYERFLARILRGVNLIAISDMYDSTFTELDQRLESVIGVLKPHLEKGLPNYSNPFNATIGKSSELKKGVRTVFPLMESNNEVVITVMEDSSWNLHYRINGFASHLYPAECNTKHCVYTRSVIIDAILTLRLRAIELFGVC